MLNPTRTAPQVYRTVWLSDIHLGFRGCSAASLLAFLRSVECEFLYLVGDIIDIWSVRKRPFWPQDHNNVLRTILGNFEVIYVPGNHDEMLWDYNGGASLAFEAVPPGGGWSHLRSHSPASDRSVE